MSIHFEITMDFVSNSFSGIKDDNDKKKKTKPKDSDKAKPKKDAAKPAVNGDVTATPEAQNAVAPRADKTDKTDKLTNGTAAVVEEKMDKSKQTTLNAATAATTKTTVQNGVNGTTATPVTSSGDNAKAPRFVGELEETVGLCGRHCVYLKLSVACSSL